MAQYWYEFGDVGDGNIPFGFKDQTLYYQQDLIVRSSNLRGRRFLDIDPTQVDDTGTTKAILIIDRKFGDFELLTKSVQRTFHTENNLYDGGRLVAVGMPVNSINTTPARGLALAVSAGFNDTQITRQYKIPNFNSNAGTVTLLPTTPATEDIRYRVLCTRISVTNGLVKTKHWYENTTEPTTWFLTHQLDVSDGYVGIMSLGGAGDRKVMVSFEFISISTEGNPLLSQPNTKIVSGAVSDFYAGEKIVARSTQSGAKYGEATVQLDGKWSMEVVVAETLPKFNYFLKYDNSEVNIPTDITGNGILSGSSPDGIVTEEGVPAVATIRVLIREPTNKAIDGYVVAETTSAVDGTWLVSNLNPELRYDVVCRYAGYKDLIYSAVRPALI